MDKVALRTEKACCDMDLRTACRIIAIFFLVSIIIGGIVTPHYFTSSNTLIGFVVQLIANVALLVGCQLNNQWLVLVWLIQAVLVLIGWPIAVFGVIFNFGGYRQTAYFSNIFLILLEYIIILVVFLLLARLVYSYWYQLRHSQSNPQHTVVV